MIYISSSCIKTKNIIESIQTLFAHGFVNIELSGGTKHYQNLDNDLLSFIKRDKVNLQCHNYFPPPRDPFVINLASTNVDIYNKSISNIKKSLSLSKKLGSKRYGFHAGFYLNPDIGELGKSITKQQIQSTGISIDLFINAYSELKDYEPDVDLYVENNVVSHNNYLNFGSNPFMLTNMSDYQSLKARLDFKLLLDVAHLKVSCKTLGLNFPEEFHHLIEQSDYIHISDNNGFADTNNYIDQNSEVYQLLSQHSLKDKTITIEVYDDIEMVKLSYNLINLLVDR